MIGAAHALALYALHRLGYRSDQPKSAMDLLLSI
jgi:hypothetical protein